MSKSESCNLITTVQDTIKRHLRISSKQYLKVVIGVSGGVDSMVLLHILKQLSVDIIVAHVNYGTRQQDSLEDQNLVEEIAKEYGFIFELFEADPSVRKIGNFQEWARDVRYRLFKSLKARYSADYIVTAHHKDDQIETILMKLLRGAGLASWSGMEVVSEDIFRPLLSVTKNELIDFAKAHNIPYHNDYTNFKTDYARNLIRLQLFEKFDKLVPGWRDNILALPETAQHFSLAIEALIARVEHSTNKLYFDKVCDLEPPLCRSLILEYIKMYAPDIELSKTALHEINSLSNLQTGQKLQLAGNIRLVRDRNLLHIDYNHNNKVQSKQNKNVQTLILSSDAKKTNLCTKAGDIIIEKTEYKNMDFEHNLYLDADTVAYPITIRPWADGDRFQPFGMDGHQLISDHLTNRKIPTTKRKQVFVAETFDQTICAVIFPPIQNANDQPGSINHMYRCTKKTEICLKIKRLRPSTNQPK